MKRLIPAFFLLISLQGQDKILWRDPGPGPLTLDPVAVFKTQPPRPPFRFVKEDFTGTNPKLLVKDAAGVEWRAKGGNEIKSETFATRLVAALGYYAEATWFIPSGRVEGREKLTRASRLLKPDGTFSDLSFERRDPQMKLLAQDWTWNANPFRGSREMQGLKILMMLLSNWDNKDARNRAIGSNTGILERHAGRRIQLFYFVNDWGQTLGWWGSEMKSKSWNCEAFTAQSGEFVESGAGGKLRFGFVGLHTDDFKNDIAVDDVRWLLGYLERLTPAQIREALLASGATTTEAACFSAALENRIRQLSRVSGRTSEQLRP